MINIPKAFKYTIVAILFFIWPGSSTGAQTIAGDSGRPAIIIKTQDFLKSIQGDSLKKMINIKKKIPGIRFDLRYATDKNFMHRRMYPRGLSVSFLRLPAATALAKVQQELQTKGLGLKIFDAYRPFSVTEKFWELVHDERYVANPSKGSLHNRGLAVDLTIIDAKTGKELDMGTGFDNFTDSAHQSFSGLSEEILRNRNLLLSTMERFGFSKLETEWWHYSWGSPDDFEVLNLSFGQIQQISDR
jgi:D-alanyl-D-alanine dipeptidase